MKIYRGHDGKLRLFRPDLNAARLVMSSTRVTLPPFNPNEFVKLLKAFMKLDGPSKSCPYSETNHSYLAMIYSR
jgi:branched-chain amino acid aminotransferase